MFWTKESRERWKDVSHIVSLLATPVIVAFGGWYIQSTIAEGNIKKEYVQLALDVLRTSHDKEDKDAKKLREWSLKMINEYAPIPLPPEAAQAFYPGGKIWLDGGALAMMPNAYSSSTSSTNCAQYYIITDDKEGFENCLARLREVRQLQEQGER